MVNIKYLKNFLRPAVVALTVTLLAFGASAAAHASDDDAIRDVKTRAQTQGLAFDSLAKQILDEDSDTAAVSTDGNGNIVLYMTSPEGGLSLKAQAVRTAFSNVIIRHLAGPIKDTSANNIVGGGGILTGYPGNSGVVSCSNGFTGWSLSGAPVEITAGHCSGDGRNTLLFQSDSTREPGGGGGGGASSTGQIGSLLFSQFGGAGNSAGNSDGYSTDVSVYSNTNSAKVNLPRVTDWSTASSGDLSTSSFVIRSVGNAVIGNMARSGRTTGYRTGSVTDVNGWARVSGRYVYGFGSRVYSSPGDSGGAVFQGDVAVGIVSGSDGEGFMWAADITTALNVAGNYKVALFLDAPVIQAPANGATLSQGAIIRGTALPGTTLTISRTGLSSNTSTTQVAADGTWSFAAPSADGTYTYSLSVSRGFDRSAWKSITVNVLGPAIPWYRISGDDRYATAAKISQSAYPNGASVLYIVSGEGFTDALAAAPPAAKEEGGAPLLLVTQTSIPSATFAEIQRLNPSSIVIIGGTGSVSNDVQSQLDSIAPTTRVSGLNRYDTSLKIAKQWFTNSSEVYLATGNAFPDALTGGAAAGANDEALILVNGAASVVDANTDTTLRELGVTSVVIVGGTRSVSSGIASDLESKGYTVRRAAGSDRYATSIAVGAVHPYRDLTRVYLASGLKYPDASTGAVIAANGSNPLYLAAETCVTQQMRNQIVNGGTSSVVLLGGLTTLTNDVGALSVCG